MTTDISSVFSPPINEQRWVRQGNSILQSKFMISEIDKPPSIFQVPKVMTETKPEAYTPNLLGLGPYHHLRPELFNMNKQKLVLVKQFLLRRTGASLNESWRSLDPVVRANYDKYLDLECATINWIVLIDSTYLFDFLGRYKENTESENLDPSHLELAKDVIMLENQIPSLALQETGKVKLGLFSLARGTSENFLYTQLFYYFCKAHSPLELADRLIYSSESKHLLAHMYHLIVKHELIIRHPDDQSYEISKQEYTLDTGIECLNILKELGLGGAMINPLLFAFKTLQVLDNSKSLVDELTQSNKLEQHQKKIIIQKVEIPSASELSKKYKIHFFAASEREGIRNVTFYIGGHDLARKLVLVLPTITLRCDVTEVVLRNLIAYEAAVKTTFELAEFVDLMCGLIHTQKDVALLRDKGIVKGNLNDEQVAKIFNGINKSAGESEKESASRKAVKQVMEVVENWEIMNQQKFGKIKRQCRFLRKNVKSGVQYLKEPFGIVMKYLLYIFIGILVVLQIMQAYCQVYGCGRKGVSEAKAFSQGQF